MSLCVKSCDRWTGTLPELRKSSTPRLCEVNHGKLHFANRETEECPAEVALFLFVVLSFCATFDVRLTKDPFLFSQQNIRMSCSPILKQTIGS